MQSGSVSTAAFDGAAEASTARGTGRGRALATQTFALLKRNGKKGLTETPAPRRGAPAFSGLRRARRQRDGGRSEAPAQRAPSGTGGGSAAPAGRSPRAAPRSAAPWRRCPALRCPDGAAAVPVPARSRGTLSRGSLSRYVDSSGVRRWRRRR